MTAIILYYLLSPNVLVTRAGEKKKISAMQQPKEKTSKKQSCCLILASSHVMKYQAHGNLFHKWFKKSANQSVPTMNQTEKPIGMDIISVLTVRATRIKGT